MSFAGLTTATQHQQPEHRPRKRYTIDNNTETIRPNTRTEVIEPHRRQLFRPNHRRSP